MKIMTIIGTRPDLIKMWSVLKKLDEIKTFEHIFVHTSQNYTKELKEFFFRDLKLRQPDYDLKIDTSSYAAEVTDVIKKSDELFAKVKPDALLVLGDLFSCLAVLPAAQRGIKIFHMEAGLRAWDKRMPEQRNRILIDHISDILLPYHPYHRENLLREGIHPSKIFLTGNPTFEVIRAFSEEIDKSQILKKLGLSPKKYILMTAHRSENVDDPQNLQSILDSAGLVAKSQKVEIIYPMHPRTQSKMKDRKLPKNVRIMNPLGYYDYNYLTKNALCLLSDSGTTPEEGLFYQVPCVSIRKSSERYETIEGGGQIVAGIEKHAVAEAVTTAIQMPWSGRYDLYEDVSPSNVVINVLQSKMQHFFE